MDEAQEGREATGEPEATGGRAVARPRQAARLRALAGAVNDHAALVSAARFVRSRLPGDHRYGDPLSTADSALLRRLSELTAQRPGVLREVGLGALQVWQAASEAQGRGRGDRELTIAFTDLERFSTYALEAGTTPPSTCCARSARPSSRRSGTAGATSSSGSATA